MRATMPTIPNILPAHMRPDLRVGGMVLAALIALMALLLSIYIFNVRAERAVLSSDTAFIFSVSTAETDTAQQARTTESTRQAAKPIAPEPKAEVKAEPEAKQDITPYATYKAPAIIAPAGVPQMAIILTGFGVSTSQSRALIDILPAGVTLGLSPYLGNDMLTVLGATHEKGLELWLDIPVLGMNALDDTGPYAIDPAASATDMNTQFLTAINQGAEYVGLLIPASLPDKTANMIAQDRGLAVASLPVQTIPSMTSEAIKAHIAASLQSGARVITLPASRLTATILQEMVTAQSISITPLSSFIKPPEKTASAPQPEAAPSESGLAEIPQQHE